MDELYEAIKDYQRNPPQPGSRLYIEASRGADGTWRAMDEQSAPETAIDGAALLVSVEAFVTKYVVLPTAARLPIALWAIVTHAFERFDCFPYLSLSSPTPRCGKTRLLEVLELLVARPWRGTAPTEAALFRFIESRQPTLLLDEVESLAKPKASDRDSAVLAILNAGYKEGQTVPRCVGNAHELQQFRVYCPKAFASIGRLPDTLSDRSIVIPMQRRAPGETVARFRFERARREAEPIRTAVEATVRRFADEIKRTHRDLPELPFLGDRDEEIFSPLFAACSVLAPERIAELQKCAEALCGVKGWDAVDDSIPLKLLADVKTVWPEEAGAVLTEKLIGLLHDVPEGPWKQEIELNPRKLSRMLRGFNIRPRTVRVEDGRGKGYAREEFGAAWAAYLPSNVPEGDIYP